jgi:hypothetical protein
MLETKNTGKSFTGGKIFNAAHQPNTTAIDWIIIHTKTDSPMTDRNIAHLDFRHLDTVLAHEKLGVAVWKQVHKILDQKIAAVKLDGLAKGVCKARLIASAIDSRINAPNLHPSVQKALRTYRDSLHAWASGAKLDEYSHEFLKGDKIDGAPVSGFELAMILQTEQMGCQTGIIRDDDQAIWLWHTEEDVEKSPGWRFDAIRIFSFRYEDHLVESFVYPDLLPGPSFGWKDDLYIQAVDTLYVKTDSNGNAIPPNIATWVALCLGGELPLTEIVDALSPYQSGYALTAVSRGSHLVTGVNVEFTADHRTHALLPNESGRYFFQVNLISDRSCLLSQKFEVISAETESWMEERIARTEKALEGFIPAPNKLRFLHQMIASQEGGEYAYVNKDVKAFILCHVCNTGLEKWIGAGPANIEEELTPTA